MRMTDVCEKQELYTLNEDVTWYAVWVRSRHEKLVAGALAKKSIPHYVPLISSRRKWSDRIVVVEKVLFPGYVFVHSGYEQRGAVLGCRGAINLVGSNGVPWPIPGHEIERVRLAVQNYQCEPYPYLRVGQAVTVTKGPLRGQEGILQRRNGKLRLILSVHLIGQSVAVEIEPVDVEPNEPCSVRKRFVKAPCQEYLAGVLHGLGSRVVRMDG